MSEEDLPIGWVKGPKPGQTLCVACQGSKTLPESVLGAVDTARDAVDRLINIEVGHRSYARAAVVMKLAEKLRQTYSGGVKNMEGADEDVGEYAIRGRMPGGVGDVVDMQREMLMTATRLIEQNAAAVAKPAEPLRLFAEDPVHELRSLLDVRASLVAVQKDVSVIDARIDEVQKKIGAQNLVTEALDRVRAQTQPVEPCREDEPLLNEQKAAE